LVKLNKFSGEDSNGKRPAVIGLPSFMEVLETANYNILGALPAVGINGYGVCYSTVTRSDGIVTCTFNLDTNVADFNRVMHDVVEDPEVDTERIGILSSCISNAVAVYHLLNQDGGPKIKAIASLAPITEWGDYASPEFRQKLKELPFINISSRSERKAGIERRMIIEDIGFLEKAGMIEALESMAFDGLEVLTMVGVADMTTDAEAVKRFHYALGGNEEKLVYCRAGHAIPYDVSLPVVTEFFRKSLL
jgi:hypothetical protein